MSGLIIDYSSKARFKMPFSFPKSSGDAGAVKRAWLRTKWLSAYEGSNPSSRIIIVEDYDNSGGIVHTLD